MSSCRHWKEILFAGGNIGFDTFKTGHQCNHFCQYFGLPLSAGPTLPVCAGVNPDSEQLRIGIQRDDLGEKDMDLDTNYQPSAKDADNDDDDELDYANEEPSNTMG